MLESLPSPLLALLLAVPAALHGVAALTAHRSPRDTAWWRAEAASPYGWLDGLAWASDGRALAVVVATGPSGGGGHEIAADASPHAPGVEVVVVPLTSVAGRLRLAAGAIRRPLSELPNVITAMGTEVSLRGADLRIDVDGERYDAGDTVQLTAMTRAWSLLVPDGAHTGAQTEATDRAD